MPEPTEITMLFSSSVGVVAVPTGENYRTAQQALAAAGFLKRDNGILTFATRDIAMARDALIHLGDLAAEHNMKLTAGTRVWIGDTARQIASLLPGTWTARVETLSVRVWQEDWAGALWDNGDLITAMRDHRIPSVAVLSDGAGTELLVADHPSSTDRELLIGVLAPNGLNGPFADDPKAPRSITTPASHDIAARSITAALLPAHRAALHDRRVKDVDQAHIDASAEFDAWTTIAGTHRYSDGSELDPADLPIIRRQFLNQVWEKFLTFLDHGGHLLDTVDPPEGVRPAHVPRGAARSLRSLRAAHAKGSELLSAWHETSKKYRNEPTALPSEPYADAVARRNEAAWPAMRIWLRQGRVLTAQSYRDRSQEQALAAGRPALPPSPGTAPVEGRGR